MKRWRLMINAIVFLAWTFFIYVWLRPFVPHEIYLLSHCTHDRTKNFQSPFYITWQWMSKMKRQSARCGGHLPNKEERRCCNHEYNVKFRVYIWSRSNKKIFTLIIKFSSNNSWLATVSVYILKSLSKSERL